jgi:DNA-binding CsgD family transcriptional regulator
MFCQQCFTAAERRFLEAIERQPLSQKELATELGCAVRTVKHHSENLRSKLKVCRLAELYFAVLKHPQGATMHARNVEGLKVHDIRCPGLRAEVAEEFRWLW